MALHEEDDLPVATAHRILHPGGQRGWCQEVEVPGKRGVALPLGILR